MRQRLTGLCGLVIAIMLATMSYPASAASDGLQQDNAYQSPQFGYTVTWGEDWTARPRGVISNPGGFDTLTLRSSLGTLLVQGQGAGIAAADAVTKRIPIEGRSDAVVAKDLDGEAPTVRMADGRNTILIEGRTLETDKTTVLIVLSAPEKSFDAALDSVREQVLLNDAPALAGSDGVGGDVEVTPDVVEPTAETTPADEPAATPSATVEPEPTEPPVDLVTPADLTDGSYTSSLYGYAFTFDSDAWTVDDMDATGDSDIVKLENDTGRLTIWSWDAYGADPAVCLEGESAWYATEDAAVSNWTPVEDEHGEPIRYETDDYAYGVFSLTYTDPDTGAPQDLVDYIECRAIPGADAVVIIHGSATPDRYNDHLDAVLDVAETITFTP